MRQDGDTRSKPQRGLPRGASAPPLRAERHCPGAGPSDPAALPDSLAYFSRAYGAFAPLDVYRELVQPMPLLWRTR